MAASPARRAAAPWPLVHALSLPSPGDWAQTGFAPATCPPLPSVCLSHADPRQDGSVGAAPVTCWGPGSICGGQRAGLREPNFAHHVGAAAPPAHFGVGWGRRQWPGAEEEPQRPPPQGRMDRQLFLQNGGNGVCTSKHFLKAGSLPSLCACSFPVRVPGGGDQGAQGASLSRAPHSRGAPRGRVWR